MRHLSVLLAGLLVSVLIPAAASAASVLDTVGRAGPISTFRGVSAYSTPSPEGFRLTVVSDGTAPRQLPVPPRTIPFDVDLGPGAQGQVLAVYSRCAIEPVQRGVDGRYPPTPPALAGLPQLTSGGLPANTSGRGCDIYWVDVGGGGGEQKLRGASTDQASETLPTIWRDEVAFVRVYERRKGKRDGLALGELPYVYKRRLDGEGGSRRQPGETRGSSGTPGPTSLDLYGRRLGLLWEYQGHGEVPDVRARVVTGGRTEVVAKVGGGGLSRAWLAGTSFDAGHFLFGVECFGDPGGCEAAGLDRKVARYRLSTKTLRAAQLPGTALTAFAAGDGNVFSLDERPVVPEVRDGFATCSFRDSDVATECDLLRIGSGELDYGPPPKGLRR